MSRPNPDVYELPRLKAELSFTKIIISIFSVFFFFIVPIVLIEQSKNPTVQVDQGKVAGISNIPIEENTIFIFNQTINLNSQVGLLVILGIILLGISILLALYLAIDKPLRK